MKKNEKIISISLVGVLIALATFSSVSANGGGITSWLGHGINNIFSGFKVDRDNVTGTIIDVYNNCKKVSNTGGMNDYFIPTNNSTEWDSFLTNTPAGLNLGICRAPWIDLKLGGDVVTSGTAAGNDIRYRSGMSMHRDVNGIYFTGKNPYSSWVKFESFGWQRGSGATLQWIFTSPDSTMLIGIGSTATSESSNYQYRQLEVAAYFSSNRLRYLYGSRGTIGSYSTQYTYKTLSSNSVYKIKFEDDGKRGGTFTLYKLPSASSSDWDDESNILKTINIGGSINPDERNIMPFIIPRSGGNQRFIAVKVEIPPTNGVCNNTVKNSCTSGISNDAAVADTSIYHRWRCDGISGGSDSGICQKLIPVPVDGGWGAWGSYGSCSQSCGGGYKYRYRSCNNPAPANGGAYCVGSYYQRTICNTRVCTGCVTADGYRFSEESTQRLTAINDCRNLQTICRNEVIDINQTVAGPYWPGNTWYKYNSNCPITGVCSSWQRNACSSGTVYPYSSTATTWRWKCLGQGGGSDSPICTIPQTECDKSRPYGCGLGYTATNKSSSPSEYGTTDYWWKCGGTRCYADF